MHLHMIWSRRGDSHVTISRRRLLGGGGMAAGALVLGGSRALARQNGAITHPTGAEERVLQVKIEGGFLPPQYLLLEMPTFSLFGDGLVVTQGPVPLIFPGSALPNLRQLRLSADGIQAVLVEARRAGLLGEDLFLRTDQIADAGTTTFTTTANGKTTVVSAYALGAEVPAGVSGSVADLYRRLAEFHALLGTLPEWLPAEAIVEGDAPYAIERLQIVSLPVDNLQVPPEPGQPPATWPLDTPLGELGAPLSETESPLAGMAEFGEARCAVFAGDAAAIVVAALDAANAQTAWESGGTSYALFPRPLLPGEEGCSPEIVDGAGTPVATPEATPEA